MSAATQAKPKPTYNFTATIPNVPNLTSSGDIKNLTATQHLNVTVPRRVNDTNGTKTVNLLPSEITNITFLFIQPSTHSKDCWKLICRPGGSSPTGSGSGSTYDPSHPEYLPPPVEGGYQHGGGGGEPEKGGYTKGGGSGGGGYTPDTSQQYPGEPGKGEYTKTKLPPPPPKDMPETGCYFIPREPNDPSKGGYYYYQNDPNDPSKGGYYYMTSSQGQQAMQQQQTHQTQTTQQQQTHQTQTMPPATESGTGGSLAINLENDLFLIGNSVIELLGKVNTLQFENGLDEEVTILIVIGYPVDRPSI